MHTLTMKTCGLEIDESIVFYMCRDL